jgi:hypothetical protein
MQIRKLHLELRALPIANNCMRWRKSLQGSHRTEYGGEFCFKNLRALPVIKSLSPYNTFIQINLHSKFFYPVLWIRIRMDPYLFILMSWIRIRIEIQIQIQTQDMETDKKFTNKHGFLAFKKAVYLRRYVF